MVNKVSETLPGVYKFELVQYICILMYMCCILVHAMHISCGQSLVKYIVGRDTCQPYLKYSNHKNGYFKVEVCALDPAF